jgi:hypothetical protein
MTARIIAGIPAENNSLAIQARRIFLIVAGFHLILDAPALSA